MRRVAPTFSLSGSRRSPRRLSRFRRFVGKLFEPLERRWLLASDAYVEFNLASNQPGAALVTNPWLASAWGISNSPGASGAFSVSNTFAARSTSYSGDVAGSPFVNNADQTVYAPLATGQVYNGNANEFIVHSQNPPPGGTTPVTGGPAEFLYASLDGTIYGFNASIGQDAVPAVSVPGAVFTGLTIANSGAAASNGDQLYAADFAGGKIDVFDPSFQPVTTSGSFTDPNLPAGYEPFNIEALGGDLYVTYTPSSVGPSGAAMQLSTPGGVVDAFDANGNFLGRIASGSPLDQPWGMAIAPQSFGQFAGDLLVANHDDGKINVFDPTPSSTATTGTSLGTLSGADGNPFVIDGLWGLSFGNGDNAGDTGSLYFTAGSLPNSVSPGLVGTIQVSSTDPLVAVGTNTTAHAGREFSGALAAVGSADLPSPAANPVASYTATIDWGDGTSTTGSVVPTDNGGFLVVGRHTYSTAGTDDYQMTIQDASGNSVTATGTVQVTAATLVAHAVPIGSDQLAVNNAIVAAFGDTGGVDPLTNYSATIDWGDGSTSTGTVGPMPAGAVPGGALNVIGSHTYTAAGDYTFTVTISDSDGSQAVTVQGAADVAQATLVAYAPPVTSDGLSVNNATVAAFVDTGGADALTNYSATIDWGDGSTSTGTVGSAPMPADTMLGAPFTVAGSHTYAASGDYTFTVTISDSDGSRTTARGVADVAPVTPAPPTALPTTLVANALPVKSDGLSVNNAIVAAFIDPGGADPLTNYSASIDWGDGSTSTGTVGSVPMPADMVLGGLFTVAGSHTYAATGDYTFTVTISDSDGSQATAQGVADVAQATLVAHALPVRSDGLSVNNATVAAFADTGGADPLANYSATIDWGDGSTSAGTVGLGPTPAGTPISIDLFTVAGSHTYTATGDYTFTVTIDDTDGSQTTVQGTVDVAQATLVAHALPVTSDGLSVNNATVAIFTDPGGPDPESNYSATIDWGDGATSTGTIDNGEPLAAGLHSVVGNHTYTATGDYTLTITINDTDGSNATVQGTVDVAQATLVAHAVPVKSEDLSVNNATVAAFTDLGGADPLANYSATIDWGDGSTSTGTVSSVPTPAGAPISVDLFRVAGSHTYTATGDYTFTVTIGDSDGSNATVQGTVDVTQPTLVAHALPVNSNGLSVNNATVAAFTDTGGADPLANYNATIDWGDGSTSTGTVGSGPTPADPVLGGFFTVAGSHSYVATGDYTFTVTISDSDGSNATVQGTVDVAQATLVAHALPVKSEGLSVNNANVAAFTDTGGADPLANYSATIDWGDGSTSTGTVGSGPTPADPVLGGFFTVAGSHSYAATGDYTFTVTINDSDGSNATVQGTVDVAQATLVAHALPVKSEGLSVNNANVAAFTDTGGADSLANYSATIDWGDGSTSTGTVSSGPTPAGAPISVDLFTVAGSHTYTATGDYTFTVTISDTDGSNATVQGTVDVAQAPLVAHALPVKSEGLSVNNAKVATFIDTGGADPLTNYSATIDWGDGSSSTGTVGSLATPASTPLGALFTVSGSHTYAATGDYTFTVTISDTDGSSATVQGTVDVTQPTLVAHALPVISQGLTLTNTALAAFTDTGGADPLTNYSATIDWGDGSTSAGTVSAGTAPSGATAAGDLFSVVGSHTYAGKGDYTFTVTISDNDGTSMTVQGTADMAQAPLLAVGVPVVAGSGLSVSGAIVAAFTDADGGDPSSSYSATIDWGDGSSTTAGTVSGSGNSFVVTGSHTYAAAGDYELKVTIVDQDGSTASTQSHAFIDSSVASFVASAFQDVLHRAADDTGLDYWTQQIAGGVAPSQFANDLTHSPEYYATNVIDPDYQRFLGRAADTAGVAYWTNQMQQGLTDQQIEADFIASPEFYAHSGGTNSSWVNAMYQMVLGRAADSGGLNYWLAQLSAGESRSSVALGFAGSQEHNAQLVQNDYFTYLGRSAGASEVNYWVAQFEDGATNEDVVSGFIGSSEYVKLNS